MDYLTHLFNLKGKTAFVTGGGSGIGAMIAQGLARAGATVFIASRKLDVCQTMANAINTQQFDGHVEAFKADFSSETGIVDAVEVIHQRTNDLHILVNNSGRSWGATYGEFPHDAWGKVFDLNVSAMFHLTQLLTDKLSASAQKTIQPASSISAVSWEASLSLKGHTATPPVKLLSII